MPFSVSRLCDRRTRASSSICLNNLINLARWLQIDEAYKIFFQFHILFLIEKMCIFARNYIYKMSRNDIISSVREYFKDQPVQRAWIFGSYARGDETPDSDIDLLVVFDHQNAEIGLMEYVRMINDLTNRLGRPVDLVEEGTLLPFAKESAERDKQLIYERIS